MINDQQKKYYTQILHTEYEKEIQGTIFDKSHQKVGVCTIFVVVTNEVEDKFRENVAKAVESQYEQRNCKTGMPFVSKIKRLK